MTSLSVNIAFASAKWKKAFPGQKIKIETAALTAFLMAKKPAAFRRRDFEVNVALSTDAAMKKLNHDFRGMNKPTNVLSFPQFPFAPGPKETATSLGDVILAFETIRRECREQGKTLENHTLHLVVHGILHLLGYDHIRLKDAKSMEKLECDILQSLGYPDPYAIIVERGTNSPHGRRA